MKIFFGIHLCFVLIFISIPFVHANYGQEAKELAPVEASNPQPQSNQNDLNTNKQPDLSNSNAAKVAAEPPTTDSTMGALGMPVGEDLASVPKLEESDDDASIPADEKSIEEVDNQHKNTLKKLEEIEALKKKMKNKHLLLQRVQSLRETVDSKIENNQQIAKEEQSASDALFSSKDNKVKADSERVQIAEQRKRIENLLQQAKEEKKKRDAEEEKFKNEKIKEQSKYEELIRERERLHNHAKSLVKKFKQDGFHTWVEKNVEQFPEVVRGTILKSANVLQPVIQGVEELTEMDEELTKETTDAITKIIPTIKNSPFYTGLIFYLILLFPTVIAIWLVMKVRSRLSLLTVEHYLIAINLYFGVLSIVCTVMTILSKTDILIVFRHRSLRLAESFMILHGILFVIHLVLHGITAYVSSSRKDLAQYICMSAVGVHFFMNAYKRAILDKDPHIGAPAYIIYSIVFIYTLYDRGVHIIEAAVKDKKDDPAAFDTYPSAPSYKTKTFPTKIRPSGDQTVYFAGLPMFNGPVQSAMNDAKTI